MSKIEITLSFDDEKFNALEFALKKENSSVQQRMNKALVELYEKTVPEAVREYVESKAAPSRPRRVVRPASPKPIESPKISQPSTTEDDGAKL